MNADIHINANGDLIGFNMFAYCSNNPVIRFDPNGEDTVSIGVGANAFLIGGVSYSIFVSIDDDGNIALQYSEANIFKERSGAVFGWIGAGVSNFCSRSFKADTVDDLNGVGTNIGFGINKNGVSIGLAEDGTFSSIGVSAGPSVGSSVTMEAAKTDTIFKVNVKELMMTAWQKVKSIFD